MARNAKERLVDFLEQRAFRPILQAKAEDYPENKRDKLQDAQRATESECERFRNYGSAEKVYDMFRDDLSSEPAKKVQRELKALDLPTLPDLQDEFERLAEEVGVKH